MPQSSSYTAILAFVDIYEDVVNELQKVQGALPGISLPDVGANLATVPKCSP